MYIYYYSRENVYITYTYLYIQELLGWFACLPSVGIVYCYCSTATFGKWKGNNYNCGMAICLSLCFLLICEMYSNDRSRAQTSTDKTVLGTSVIYSSDCQRGRLHTCYLSVVLCNAPAKKRFRFFRLHIPSIVKNSIDICISLG